MRSTRLVNTCKKLISTEIKTKKLTRFTLGSVVVHFRKCCGPLLFKKKVKKRQQKLVLESLRPTKRNHEVHLTVCCSAVFSLKQCVLLSHDDFGVTKKQSVRFLLILKLLLNRKELERVFYMKKLRLVDIFPTAYDLNHFDQRFVKKSRKTAAASRLPLHDFQN